MHNDQYYMQLVLDLAKSTMHQTLPNPQVAAVVVKDSRVLGVGCHLRAGGDHAEIYALKEAGVDAIGATLYVNLEPCAHHGKTPPCTTAIIAARIKRVVVANLDPNPLVNGRGVAQLEAAGIEVRVGLLADQASQINQVFFHNIKYKQPFVTLKVGMSLDGKIATKTNLSQWITGPESRQDAHLYRIAHTAILVGVNTVISDNPSLTPHLVPNASYKPIRIILDRSLRTPLSAKLLNDKQAPTWICTTNQDIAKHQEYVELGVKIVLLPDLEIGRVLDQLYQEQIYSLLVEGGEGIYASFIESKRINQLVAYISPQLIGGRDAKHFFAGNGFADLTNNFHLAIREVKQLGTDIKIVCVTKVVEEL